MMTHYFCCVGPSLRFLRTEKEAEDSVEGVSCGLLNTAEEGEGVECVWAGGVYDEGGGWERWNGCGNDLYVKLWV